MIKTAKCTFIGGEGENFLPFPPCISKCKHIQVKALYSKVDFTVHTSDKTPFILPASWAILGRGSSFPRPAKDIRPGPRGRGLIPQAGPEWREEVEEGED